MMKPVEPVTPNEALGGLKQGLMQPLFPLPRRKHFLRLNLGLLLTAMGLVFFKTPNHFAMGHLGALYFAGPLSAVA